MARVPIYGKLSFRDRAGQPAEKGVSVGKEWTYRSYFEGGTLAAAVWTFDGITEEAFPEGLPIELSISIFRTYTGQIEKGVPASLSLRNPKTGKTVEVRIFAAKDYVLDTQFIPREIISPSGEKLRSVQGHGGGRFGGGLVAMRGAGSVFRGGSGGHVSARR